MKMIKVGDNIHELLKSIASDEGISIGELVGRLIYDDPRKQKEQMLQEKILEQIHMRFDALEQMLNAPMAVKDLPSDFDNSW